MSRRVTALAVFFGQQVVIVRLCAVRTRPVGAVGSGVEIREDLLLGVEPVRGEWLVPIYRGDERGARAVLVLAHGADFLWSSFTVVVVAAWLYWLVSQPSR